MNGHTASALLSVLLPLAVAWAVDRSAASKMADSTAQVSIFLKWALLFGMGWGLILWTAVAFLNFDIQMLPPATSRGAFSRAFLGAALPEETGKFFALGIILIFWRRTSEPKGDVFLFGSMISGIMLGLGFAAFENLAYWDLSSADGDVGFMRLLTAVPCHALLGLIMGRYLGDGSWYQNHRSVFKAWSVPVLVHGLYNLPLMLDPKDLPSKDGADDLLLSVLVLGWLVAWSRSLLAEPA